MKLKTTLVAALLALAASAVLAACGSDAGGPSYGGSSERKGDGSTTTPTQSTPPPEPAFETIVVRDGKPVGGVQELEYGSGERVRFRVRSDVADEVHVHGYDLSEDVAAGGSVSFSFPADIEGIFEVELEERGEQIAELRVNP